jgi:hypothetical protein
MLFAMDGNDSLKRVYRRDLESNNIGGALLTGQRSHERPDTRTCGEEYFVPREIVDALGNNLKDDMHSVDDKVRV